MKKLVTIMALCVFQLAAAEPMKQLSKEHSYSLEEVEERPQIIKRTTIKYPTSLRKKKIEGEVTVELIVSEQGKVSKVLISNSSHELFSKSVLSSIKNWRFQPALIEGKPVKVKVRTKIPFKIQ